MRQRILVFAALLLLTGACQRPTATPTAVLPTATTGASAATNTPGVTPSPDAPDLPDAIVPFDEHLQAVRDATFEDFAGRDGARVRDADAFEEMRAHILRMYDGVQHDSSFVVESATFDCITTDSQPSVRLQGLTEIQREGPTGTGPAELGEGEPPGAAQELDSPLRLGLTDPFGNAVSCPDDTIPMARLTLERITLFETLDQFFGKGPDGFGTLPTDVEILPEGDSSVHKYAYARQDDVTSFGGNSWLNLWSPAGGFSLSQQWYAGGSGDGQQTVEGGWVVYKPKFATDKAVLFIFYTADNYKKAKCYNLDCAAFVQTNKNWYLGGPWSQYSAMGGDQWGFGMQWKFFRGNWWLFLKGPGAYEAVGYYPTSIFGTGQLASNATQITYGGETAGKDAWPEMGSSRFAADGWQRAAFQKEIFNIPRDEDNGVGVWANLTAQEPSPSCYTIDLVPSSNGGDWGTYFFFGGPGGNGC